MCKNMFKAINTLTSLLLVLQYTRCLVLVLVARARQVLTRPT